MARRQIALGDADEARQACLGRQQVVVVLFQAAVGDAIADRQKLVLAIEQEAELHVVEQLARARGERQKPVQ